MRGLATDLDGTLIPLAGNERNRLDLPVLAEFLRAHDITLVFVTGRHCTSVLHAIDEFQLPRPDWVICDVGTSVYRRQQHGYELVDAFHGELAKTVGDNTVEQLSEQLSCVEGLRLQESEKQGRFKLSYYVEARKLNALVEQCERVLSQTSAPYSMIHSVDPFNGDGLIDFLPSGASKAYAVQWWARHIGFPDESIVFAGDSGNDLAALTIGYRAILVSNASRDLAEQVSDAHRACNWHHRLHLSQHPATSGVLEGMVRFAAKSGS